MIGVYTVQGVHLYRQIQDMLQGANVARSVTFYKGKICPGAQVEPGSRPEGSSVG